MEVWGAAASSSSGSRSTSVASSRASAFARATWAPMPARPRAAMVAHVLSARKGRVCSSPYSANVPTERVAVLAQVWRDEAERVAQVVAAPHQGAAGVDGNAEPLVRVEHQRVGPFHAAVAGRDRRVEHPERAVGAVDVEPEVLRGRHVGERVERVDRAGVDGAGRADEQRRQGTRSRDRRRSSRAARSRRAGLPRAAPRASHRYRGRGAPERAARSYGPRPARRRRVAGRRRGRRGARHGPPPPARGCGHPQGRRSSRRTRRW